MSAKFSARIRQKNKPDVTAYVEANDIHDAKSLFYRQYGQQNVNFVEEVPYSSTGDHSDYDGLSDGFSSTRQILRPIFLIILALAIGREGFNKYIKPIFEPEASQEPVVSKPIEQLPEQTQVIPTNLPEDPVHTEDQKQAAESHAIETEPEKPDELAAAPESQLSQPVVQAISLSKFVITVSRKDQQIETFTLSAKNEDDARRIVRDFRGNPSIISINPGAN